MLSDPLRTILEAYLIKSFITENESVCASAGVLLGLLCKLDDDDIRGIAFSAPRAAAAVAYDLPRGKPDRHRQSRDGIAFDTHNKPCYKADYYGYKQGKE